jgi:sec-independent protein translocase protein TatB
VFGLSFGELVVVILVGLMIFGPKELPKVLRKLGQWSGKIRRYAMQMRAQSGIDDVLRNEGLDEDIAEITKLARGEVQGVVAATRGVGGAVNLLTKPAERSHSPNGPTPQDDPNAVVIEREREFPREGSDSYGALPDTAIVYANTLPASALAKDAIYMQGDEVIADAPAPAPAPTPAQAPAPAPAPAGEERSA